MRATLALLSNTTIHLTLFTRANCGLCTVAKSNIAAFLALPAGTNTRLVPSYEEIDVMVPGQKQWKDMYEFDVPVLHVERRERDGPPQATKKGLTKLMHRFSAEEVGKAVEETEKRSG